MAVAAPPRHNRPTQPVPLRIVTAVPRCDGHDSAIMTINHELVRQGAEVVYLGFNQSASAIARAAVQEDAHAVGISSYNGGHVVFFREVLRQLRAYAGRDIKVFGGGGGTITPGDAAVMRRDGVEHIFFAGTPLEQMIHRIAGCARTLKRDGSLLGDRTLARQITLAEYRAEGNRPANRPTGRRPFVLGVAGPGGVGKSTLIDELTARFLRQRRSGRLAILASDPSHPDTGGALLGDRVSAVYAQTDRVFFRSMATQRSRTGISAATSAAIRAVQASGAFELVIIESVGIGQDSDPFEVAHHDGDGIADAVLYVTTPHYGGRLQLEKTTLLHHADFVALNKGDDPRVATAKAELLGRLPKGGHATLHVTIATQHEHTGIDDLYHAIAERAGLEPAGGERACHLQINE